MYICTCCLLEFFILLFCSVSKLHNFVQSSCKTRVPLSCHYVLNYILVKTSIWIKNFRHSEKKMSYVFVCLMFCLIWGSGSLIVLHTYTKARAVISNNPKALQVIKSEATVGDRKKRVLQFLDKIWSFWP